MRLLDAVKEKFGEVDVVISIYSMQIIWASKAFHTTLGYDEDELVEAHIRNILSTDSASLTSLMANMLGNKTEIKDERLVMKKSGEKIMIKAVLKTITHEKEPYVVIKIL